MTRRELSIACGLTGFGSSVLAVGFAYALFQGQLDAISESLARLEHDKPPSISVEGASANVAIVPTVTDAVRERLIERYSQPLTEAETHGL